VRVEQHGSVYWGQGVRSQPNGTGRAQIRFYVRSEWGSTYLFIGEARVTGSWDWYAEGGGRYSGPGTNGAWWELQTPV
jgi:hypothetical protein